MPQVLLHRDKSTVPDSRLQVMLEELPEAVAGALRTETSRLEPRHVKIWVLNKGPLDVTNLDLSIQIFTSWNKERSANLKEHVAEITQVVRRHFPELKKRALVKVRLGEQALELV